MDRPKGEPEKCDEAAKRSNKENRNPSNPSKKVEKENKSDSRGRVFRGRVFRGRVIRVRVGVVGLSAPTEHCTMGTKHGRKICENM